MFYDEFIKLCNSIQRSPTSVAKAIGLAGAHVTKWKNGSTPTDATIYKICDFFDLPYNYFDKKEDSPKKEEPDLKIGKKTITYIDRGDGHTKTKEIDEEKYNQVMKMLRVLAPEVFDDEN